VKDPANVAGLMWMLVVALHLRSVAPESSSHDQLESWGPEGRLMAQKLMAHVVARASALF
jgi:hypothetical protein